MDLEKLDQLAKKYRVHLYTLTHDYALTNLLSIISEFPRLDAIVFKGGTALKKIHYEDFRFSMDLDFSCKEDVTEEFVNFIRDNMKSLDVKFARISNEVKNDLGLTFRAVYERFDKSLTSVRFDLSLRGDMMLEAVTKPVLHPYDISKGKFEMPAMQLKEVMAEKVRAVMYSKHPRHVHDLAFLIDRKVELDPEMARTKIRSVYEDEFSMERFKSGVAEKEEFWKRDLTPFLPKLPSFDVAAKKAIETVDNIMG